MGRKYRIEFTEEQLRIVMAGMDLKARLNMGQLEELGFALRLHGNADLGLDPGTEKALLNRLKALYFPDLHPNGCYGIRNENVPEWDKRAYDMIQVMRKAIHDVLVEDLTAEAARAQMALDEDKALQLEQRLKFLRCTVSAGDYYGVASTEPPITVEVIDE